jgi:hypothetical protein
MMRTLVSALHRYTRPRGWTLLGAAIAAWVICLTAYLVGVGVVLSIGAP